VDFQSVGLPSKFLESDGAVSAAANVAFLEGPTASAEGQVFFSDIANNRIMVLELATGDCQVWKSASGCSNGLLFDAEGHLLACEGDNWQPHTGNRRISRTNIETGQYEVLTERFEGARYNAPNDIAARKNGQIFFTDPCYGDRDAMEMEHESVYRLDPDGSVTRLITQPDIQRPNGIAISPDEKSLYVVDSCPIVGGNRKVWAFNLAEEGGVSEQRCVIDFAPGRGVDGMAVDSEGRLYLAAGIARPRGEHETDGVPPGIWIVTPEGEVEGRIPMPEDVLTNVTFGGEDLRSLFVTAGKTLFTIRVSVPGYVVHRPL